MGRLLLLFRRTWQKPLMESWNGCRFLNPESQIHNVGGSYQIFRCHKFTMSEGHIRYPSHGKCTSRIPVSCNLVLTWAWTMVDYWRNVEHILCILLLFWLHNLCWLNTFIFFAFHLILHVRSIICIFLPLNYTYRAFLETKLLWLVVESSLSQ